MQNIKKVLGSLMLLLILLLLAGCFMDLNQIDLKSETTQDYIKEQEKHPIDTKFYNDLENGNETYTVIVQNYRDNWKKEYSNTTKTVPQFFSEDVAQQLCDNLNAWEQNLQSNWQWQNEYFFEYSKSKYGTIVYDDAIKSMGDEYRAKTLWLQNLISITQGTKTGDGLKN